MNKFLVLAMTWLMFSGGSAFAQSLQFTMQETAANYTATAAVGANGYYIAHTASAMTSSPGPSGTLARFINYDGTSDGLRAESGNSGVAQNKAVVTVMAWVKLTTSDTTANHRVIFVSTNSSAVGRTAIYINSTGQVIPSGRAGDAETTQSVTSTSSYDDNTWHHLAAVFNYAGDAITLYVDGVSVAQTGTVSFTATATSNTASAHISFGSDASSNWYKGGMADARVYDSDQSANLSTIMGTPSPASSTVIKILLQLSDTRLRKQTKHFNTYGVYALTP